MMMTTTTTTRRSAPTAIALTALLAALAAPPLAAMDWPQPGGVMTTGFGVNDQGRAALGVAFRGDGPVTAADPGELLFQSRPDDDASRLPSPLGAWTALDHGNGIIGVYARMADSDQTAASQAAAGDPVGEAGATGWSAGPRGCYFSLYDRKERRWINPSRIITPFADTLPPVILAVRLRAGNGRVIDLSAAGVAAVAQGRYTVAVETHDLRLPEGEKPLTPFRVICSVNGSEIGALGFETYSARDGLLMAYRNGLVPVHEVYARPPAYEVGEVRLIRGQATLEIIAQDIAGNSRSAVFRLNVE